LKIRVTDQGLVIGGHTPKLLASGPSLELCGKPSVSTDWMIDGENTLQKRNLG
jgi:hypothetical protein